MPRPTVPIVFLSNLGSISNPGDDIIFPKIAKEVVTAPELVAVIGKKAKDIPESEVTIVFF